MFDKKEFDFERKYTRDINGDTEEEFLKKYKPGNYEKPSVTVDMLLFTTKKESNDYKKLDKVKLQIGLIKRKAHPYINHWAICGGFVSMDENLEEAARRELMEETNIKDVYIEQLYTFGNVNRDPRMRVIDVSYYALIPEAKLRKSNYKAGDDASDIAFFDILMKKVNSTSYILTLSNEEKNECIRYEIGKEIKLLPDSTSALAFDHIQILNMAISRLQNKLLYTDIGLHLLNEEFTLAEAQCIFEAILNRKLIRQNFRTKLLNMGLVEETGKIKKEDGKGYRPSQLYTLRNKI